MLKQKAMIREDGLLKYPRTPHLEGSRLQEGDSAADQAPLSSLAGLHVVLEEKVDGANSGVSFSEDAQLQLQSRGHFLTGGAREKHFNQLKAWAQVHEDAFFDVLGTRYIMFGEWMFAKHSMYYDALPHLFLEFDVFDRQEGIFLSTERRRQLLEPLAVVSVPVLHEGLAPTRVEELHKWIGLSLGRTEGWRQSLAETAQRRSLDVDRVNEQTDGDERVEGLYLKVEDQHQVLARFKFVRASFTQTLLDQDEHWLKRPLIPNQLKPGVDLFAPTVDKSWPAFRPASTVKAPRR